MREEIKIALASSLLFAGLKMSGEEIVNLNDSAYNLTEVTVLSSKITDGEFIQNEATKSLHENQILQGKSIPYITQQLPSTVSFSEDGSGNGNSSLRIRGTDATRIGVTLNGMPLNNPESQEVYWVNLPNISNSLKNIKIQRGVSLSTSGPGGFGAGIAMKTEDSNPKPYGEISTTIGSYNTFIYTLAGGSGLTRGGLSIDGRYSKIDGNGYIRNSKTDHRSLYLSLIYYRENQSFKIKYINGIQHTGITWEGVSPEMMAVDRRYNPAGKYYDDEGNIAFYENETDNYYSNIVLLSYTNVINHRFKLDANLNYNHGYGYYENYKTDQNLETFGLSSQAVNDTTYNKSDIIYRKFMSNNYYNANVSLSYTVPYVSINAGLNGSMYHGKHYGKLQWIKYMPAIHPNYSWYNNSSDKNEGSLNVTVNLFTESNWTISANMEGRIIGYEMEGMDDDLINISNFKKYNFFNPKLAISYSKYNHSIFTSLALTNREPLRADIVAAVKGNNRNMIKPERLYDFELGYKFLSTKIGINANLYGMYYRDQMIQTGRLNDVGYKLMENVPDSYRVGLELECFYKPFSWLQFDGNLTISKNKIKKYTAYYDFYDNQIDWTFLGQVSEYLGTTDISFSPNLVGTSMLTMKPANGLQFSLTTKYVGKQFYDNTSDKNNRLADYLVAGFSTNYTFKTRKTGIIDMQFSLNNLFNKKYIANAWTATDKFQDGTSVVYTGYFPQATRNFTCTVSIKL